MPSAASDSKTVAPARGRARVSGKTSFSRLSIAKTVEALGLKADALRRRVREGSMPQGRDRHAGVYALVGAYSNLPRADHSRRRKPQDEAIIRDLEFQAANLRRALGPREEAQAPSRSPRAPEASR